MMNVTKNFIYDGSFNGFLTTVFIGFKQKLPNANIRTKNTGQDVLFSDTETIFTNVKTAKRVWDGINKKDYKAIKSIYFAFQSKHPQIETLLYYYIQKIMNVNPNSTPEISDNCVLKINQLAHKVGLEKQRTEAFTSFKLSKDDVSFYNIAPEYDILPLLSKHFRNRYPRKEWIVYDTERNYGLYYNLLTTEVISLDLEDVTLINNTEFDVFNTQEQAKQDRLNTYFKNNEIKHLIKPKLYNQKENLRMEYKTKEAV